MVKSASFGVMHLGIAFTVCYALTGSIAIASAITFVEPLVNTVAHYFFDKHWDDERVHIWFSRRKIARAGQIPSAHGAV